MKRQIWIQRGTWWLIGLIILLPTAGFAATEDLSGLSFYGLSQYENTTYKQGELIVHFSNVKPGTRTGGGPVIYGPLTQRATRNVISDFIVEGASVKKDYEHFAPGLTVVKLPEDVSVADVLVRFNQSANVLYAEPNYKFRIFTDDPRYSEQWALNNTGQTGGLPDADIDAPEGWGIQPTASNIKVAVIDTGIDYGHPDLRNRMWINNGEAPSAPPVLPEDFNDVDDDDNGYIDDIYGYDFVDDDGDPCDEHGHGTHVAGIIGAEANNQQGISGVCWNVQLMALRAFDENGNTDEGILIESIYYAVNRHVDVINASWGGEDASLGLYTAINAARSAGILFVAAAGNEGNNNDGAYPIYPASYNLDNIISVMATDHTDSMVWYSNYGATSVDLGAPGYDILSTTPMEETQAMADEGIDTEYDLGSGTSMAAPHVAGACALIKAENGSLTYSQIKAIILRGTDPVLPGRCFSGGRLNLYTSLQMARIGRVLNRNTSTLYTTIQEAIDEASNGDEIIAHGNRWYFERIDFNGMNITLRSGDVDHPSDTTIYPTTTYISAYMDKFNHNFGYVGPVVTINKGENNQASISGFTILEGDIGVVCQGTPPTINTCTITQNEGTGIYCSNSDSTITGCTISNNSYSNGGGIFCSNSDPYILSCTITSNTATNRGGGIYCNSSAPVVSNCNITYNDAQGGSGGGIYSSPDSVPYIYGGSISNNTSAGQGGGIYMSGSPNQNIRNCTLSGNTSEWEGGGIYIYGTSPRISDCQITDCYSHWDGGGIYCDTGAEPNISNSTIMRNMADYDGGGIYCNGTSPKIKNCLIVDNTVDSWDCGGIFCWDASPTITNCTFAGNSGNEYDGLGGAMYCLGTSKPVITNCIFSNNSDIAIYEGSTGSDPNIRWSLFYSNTDGDYYDKDSAAVHDYNSLDPDNFLTTMRHYNIGDTSDSNNIYGNPMFVTGRLGGYYLSQFAAGQILDVNRVPVDPNVNPEDATSPAVDAGSGDANDPNIAMYMYSTRTDNFQDPNTGEKDLGKVDIGFHYNDLLPAVTYELTTDVNNGTVSPSGGYFTQYSQILLVATSDDPSVYQLKSWQGTDDDTSMELSNIVTMNSNKEVHVVFETILVYLRARVVDGNGDVSPRNGAYPRGSVVTLTATPANPEYQIRWSGSDDDFSHLLTNTVTMSDPFDGPDENVKIVNVVFYLPRIINVPGDFTNLQHAIDDADPGDIILIAPSNQPYYTVRGYTIINKAITITSTNPDDPNVVAQTVIELQTPGPDGRVSQGFYFYYVGPDTVLNGLTIRGFQMYANPSGMDADPDVGNYDGVPGGDMYGSGIICVYASPMIKNCVVTDCTATGGDGGNGADGDGGDGHPDGGHGGWPGEAGGGGLACVLNSSPFVINCTFNNCQAIGGNGGNGGDGDEDAGGVGGRGGGWYYDSNPNTPYEFGPFDFYTKYTGHGGAVYADANSSPTFQGCTFTNNTSEGGTSGIHGISSYDPDYRPEPTINWTIDNFGGAVYVGGYPADYSGYTGHGEATFEDCTFINNTADTNGLPNSEDEFVSYGGAVAFQDDVMPSFKNCTFNANTATIGGAMYWEWAEPSISDCDFIVNQGVHGGGVYFVGGSAEIARCDFSNNQAGPDLIPGDPNIQLLGQGGGIYCFDSNALIVDCDIATNNAFGSGGGIYISGREPSKVKNCLITGNSAYRDGGGISVNWYSKPEIANCTIVDNVATGIGYQASYGGGLYGSYHSFPNVINSILWDNSAEFGDQIAVGTGFEYDTRPATVGVSYSDIQGGILNVFVDTGCALDWDPNSVINANPLFINGYYLTQIAAGQKFDSPCVNTGSANVNSVGMVGTYTTRSDAIPDSGMVDMGYHYGYPYSYFGETEYVLTLIVIGHGTVAVDPNVLDPNNELYNPENNIFTYKYSGGGILNLTAIPDEGYRVKNWTGTSRMPGWNINTNKVIMDGHKYVTVEFEQDITYNLLVPSEYPTIEEAIAEASYGGTNVIVSPGVHYVTSSDGIDLTGKSITIMSIDPDDPNVIANTIIDAQGSLYNPRRAFHFHRGEDPNTIIWGLTIRNGYMRGPIGTAGRYGVLTPVPYELIGDNVNSPPRAERGQDAIGDSYGGGILCENASSPTFKNCVITNCTVTGAQGGAGADGQWTTALSPEWQYLPPGETDPFETGNGQWGGHAGTGTGMGYGGAIACVDRSSPVIIDCTLRDNTARGGMGGAGGTGGTSEIGAYESWGGDGGAGIGDGVGGAIYCDIGSTPVIAECNFVNNTATVGNGGEGGAAGQGQQLNPPAQSGAYGSNYGYGSAGGGAVYYTSGEPNLINCTFFGNQALYTYSGYDENANQTTIPVHLKGGALYFGSYSTIILNNLEFTGNPGGAVFIESDCIVDINDCLFKSNELLARTGLYYIGDYTEADYETGGAAIHISPDCNYVNIRNCKFQDNYSFYNGGAVDCRSDANFIGCSFGSNRTGGDGGAIGANYLDGDNPNITTTLTLNLESCSFAGNKAVEGITGFGGSIFFRRTNATFTDCYFTSNSAKSGGALFLTAGSLNLTGGFISENRAVGGSGIDTSSGFDMVGIFGVSHATDMSGGYDLGGGIVCAATHATIENCTFNNNTVQGVNGSGGAINFIGGYVAHTVKNCLMTGNTAAKEGGAISCALFATPEIKNCTFSNNAAGDLGGAIYCDWGSNPTVTDSILQNCNSHAIAEEDFGNAIVQYSLFHNNPDGDYGIYDTSTSQTSTFSGGDLDVTNITGDPLFTAGPLSSYYLSQISAGQLVNSPAVNAGSDLALNLGLSTRTSRTDGVGDTGIVDIGYHHPDHSTLPMYQLTAAVIGGHGTVEPTGGTYYAGTPVTLTAKPGTGGYRVAQWSGTINDTSKANTNIVVMSSDKNVTVQFGQPRTLVVASKPDYTTIQQTIDAAEDGDVVLVPTGHYDSPYPGYPYPTLIINDKNITLTGTNPDDPVVVAATVLDNYIVEIYNTDTEPGTIIDGLTFTNSRMHIYYCSPNVRNCIFTGCNWFGNSPPNPVPPADDGQNGGSVNGGAMAIYNGSPLVQNCTFQNCSATGGNGAPGNDSEGAAHPEGYDGGWGGWAYGGAVYMGFGSNPIFADCSFINCFTRGGNGGDGGNSMQNPIHGGRGGGWEWADSEETGPLTYPNWYWWDGWEWAPYDATGIPGSDIYPPYTNQYKDYWKYSGYGGAVYCENDSSPTFIDCNFIGNYTYGGVCGLGGTDWETPDQRLKIENFGGAVYASYGSNLEFVNCNFNNNTADTTAAYIGEVVDATGEAVLATLEASFNDDPYISYGGAVACESDCSLNFANCTITNNNACIGGGVYWTDSKATIVDCNFIDSTAYHGAGLYSVDSTATITSSTIAENDAIGPSYVPLVDATLTPYDAGSVYGQGGGYYCFATLANIKDTIFSDNTASCSGGGIYIGGNDQDMRIGPLLHNCLITDNAASRDGGGISANWYSDSNVVNCTITGNRISGGDFGIGYGGGVYCSYDSSLNIVNTIIWGNTGEFGAQGAQIAVATGFEYEPRPSKVNITYSDIQNATDPNMFNLKNESLDLVFCIDSTGSMYDDIDAVKDAANQITNAIAAAIPDFRIAVTEYRDFNQPNADANEPPYGDATDYPYRTVVEFTTDTSEVVDGLNSIVAGGGADIPESVYTALMHTIDHNTLEQALDGELYGAESTSMGPGAWRTGNVMRVIILMGDAPPHDPEPFTDYTLDDITDAATDNGLKRIVPLMIGGDAEAAGYFRSLANRTGGTVLQADNADEVVEVLMKAIEMISVIADPIFVDANCILSWEPTTYSWDPNTHNIDEDPLFIAGYHLRQTAAGQDVDSPCVDTGSAAANTPYISLDTYTTRTDSVPDAGIVDMGYHYKLFTIPQYKLTINAIDANVIEPNIYDPNYDGLFDWYKTVTLRIESTYDANYYQVLWSGTNDDSLTGPENTVTMYGDKSVTVRLTKSQFDLAVSVDGENGRLSAEWLENSTTHTMWDPDMESIKVDTVVQLTAKPDSGYRVKKWTGTDDDSSRANTNTVTMNSDRTVSVEFGPPATVSVPGDYPTIQDAVSGVEAGDTVIVEPGTYQGGYSSAVLIIDKPVLITSVNPDDPCCVAATVIDGYWGTNVYTNRGIIITPNATEGTVINGLTIQNCGGRVGTEGGDNGDWEENHPNGYDGVCGEGAGIYIMQGASPTIKNCVIMDNLMIGGDGGAGVDADDANNAGRGGWAGWARGAGVYCSAYTSPTFINCKILNNQVQGGNAGNGGSYAQDGGMANYGGSWSANKGVNIHNIGLDYDVVDSNLWEVWAWDQASYYWTMYGEPDRTSYFGDYRWYSGYGGGVFCDIGSNVTFDHCEIRGNQSDGGISGQGGVMGAGGRQQEPLIPYEIPSYGGGVYCAAETSIMFIDCTITENSSSPYIPDDPDNGQLISPYIGFGGGVCAESTASVEFTNCTVSENQASLGGGIFLAHLNQSITNSSITDNVAISGGGACLVNSTGTIVRSDFTRNDANGLDGHGGGIYGINTDVLIADCNISHNDANSSGGGVYMTDSASWFKNCLIANNLAGRAGGGVSLTWYSEPIITNCTFVGNAAPGTFGEPNNTSFGGGLHCSYNSYCTVTDSIFWDNLADNGAQISVHTGFEYDKRPSDLTISYSDVKGGKSGIMVDTDCTLNWLAGNTDLDPLFVSGQFGNYYLSQTDSGQAQNSPCVNTGSDLASSLDMVISTFGLARYTTRTDGEADTGTVDMGYHYPTILEPCRYCDLINEGFINFKDFAKFASHWLEEGCSNGNDLCDGADFNVDTYVDNLDLAYFVNCWLAEDNTAPIPNPSEWQTLPYQTSSTTIAMKVKEAYDGWGWDIQYLFERLPVGDPNSGWQASRIWNDTGLTPGVRYGYRVKARDELGNETKWSDIAYAGEDDTTPPAPAPYLTDIQATSPNTVTMTASITYDDSGIEYYFDCDSGGHDSGWLEFEPDEEPNYTDTGLEADTTYYYRVKARDKSDAQNETVWSDWYTVTTNLPLDDLAPEPDPMEWDPVVDANGFDGEPRLINIGGGTFDWYATMTATAATDVAPAGLTPTTVWYKFVCTTSGKSGLSSGWQTALTYTRQVGGATVVTDWYVIAQDDWGNQTAPSPVIRAEP